MFYHCSKAEFHNLIIYTVQVIGIALLIYFTTADKAEANVTEYICNCCCTKFPQRVVADVKGFEHFCLYLVSVIKYPDIFVGFSPKSIVPVYPPNILLICFYNCIIYSPPPHVGWGLDVGLAPAAIILLLRCFLVPVLF